MFSLDQALTVLNAKHILAAGLVALRAGQTEFDLARLTQVDSSAVVTLLAWQRAAHESGQTLQFNNMPASLHSLVKLYGVEQLLQA